MGHDRQHRNPGGARDDRADDERAPPGKRTRSEFLRFGSAAQAAPASGAGEGAADARDTSGLWTLGSLDPFSLHLLEADTDGVAELGPARPYDFVFEAGSPAQIADALTRLPAIEQRQHLSRLHEVRGNDIAHRVEAALMRRAEPFVEADDYAFGLPTLEAALAAGDDGVLRDLTIRLLNQRPHTVGVALAALYRAGRLDAFLSRLPHGYPRELERRLPPGHDFRAVRFRLRAYHEGHDETDHSVTGMLRQIPYAGDALAFGFDGLTFGFASEHDAAYRAKRSGAITEDEYIERSDAAGARTVAIGTMSIATGGVAGSYASGLMTEVAAAGTAGRVTSAVVSGATGGAGGGVGAQLGADVVSGQLSSPSQYLHSAAIGAGFGAAGGGVVGAAAETAAVLPASTQSAIARLAQRFPVHAEIFEHYRALGEAHAATIRASRLHRLLADGAANLAQPELAAVVAGLAPDTLVTVTGRLDDRGLQIVNAEPLGAPAVSPASQPMATSRLPDADRPTPGARIGATDPTRVHEPVPGLYESIDPNKPPSGWKISEESPDPTREHPEWPQMTTTVTGPDGSTGWIQRSYDPQTNTLIMENAFLNNLPRWMASDVPMVPGKGIPTVTYLTLHQMKLMQIQRGSLNTVKMSTIQNIEAVMQLEQQARLGVSLDDAVAKTHSVEYASASIQQSGHRLGAIRIDVSNTWRWQLRAMMNRFRMPADTRARLFAKYGLGPDDTVLVNYDIYIDVVPVSPE